MEHVAQLSFFQVLFSPTGIIVLIMAFVCAGMLAMFLPGGFRKLFAVIAVFVTAGAAIFFLKRNKNKLIGEYNVNVDKYLDVIAEKKRIDTQNSQLRREIDTLEGQAGASKEQLDQLMTQYESSLKEANKKNKLRAELSSEIERHADKLDQGYEIGSAAAFRSRWESLKTMTEEEVTGVVEDKVVVAAPVPAPVVTPVVPKVEDEKPEPEPEKKLIVDVRFDAYRLKGDIY